MPRYSDYVVITKQPTISSAATGYVAGDVVGGVQTIPCGLGADITTTDSAKAQLGSQNNAAPLILNTLTVVEQSTQASGLDVFLFSTSPTLPADNAAFDITDTQMKDCIGVVNIPSASYRTAVSNCVQTVGGLNIVIQPVASGTVYAAVAVRSATTYSLASGLVFKYGFTRGL